MTISLTGKSWYLYTDLCSTYYTCLTETGLTAFWEKKLSDFKWTVRKITMNINLYSHPLNHIAIITSWAMHTCISINMIVINLCFNNNCLKVKFNFYLLNLLYFDSTWCKFMTKLHSLHIRALMIHGLRSNWIKQLIL